MDSKYRITKIGSIPHDCGSDEYLLVKNVEDDIDMIEVEAQILEAKYVECDRPGGYFCNSVRAIPDDMHSDRCIVVVYHRYDI